jgi:hypothetical protein
MIKTMKEIIDNKERLVCSSRTPSCCRTTLTEKKKRKRKRKGKSASHTQKKHDIFIDRIKRSSSNPV